MIIPFTCKQLHGGVLIGFPLLLILGLIFHEALSIILGTIGTASAWIISLGVWIEEGKIKCRCNKK